MSEAWIKAEQRADFLPGTAVVKRDGDFLLIAHPSIPHEADHVAVEQGRYRVIPNPSGA